MVPSLQPSAPPYQAVIDNQTSLKCMDLEGILQRDAVVAFSQCLDFIFQHSCSDVKHALWTVDLPQLQTIRNLLLDLLVTVLPETTGKRPIKRQNKNTVIPDIYCIGYSIVNKSPSRDLDNVFAKASASAALDDDVGDAHSSDNTKSDAFTEPEVPPTGKTLSDLSSVVAFFMARIETLEAELADVKMQLGKVTCASSVEKEVSNHLNVKDHDDQSQVPNNERDFQTQSRRGRRKSQKKSQTQPKAIPSAPAEEELTSLPSHETEKQSSDSTTLPSSDKERYQVYIGGVHPECTVRNLKDYFKAQFKMNIANKNVRVLSRQEHASSFRVSVPVEKKKNILNGTWPEGIYARPFRPEATGRRRQQQSSGLHGASKWSKSIRNEQPTAWYDCFDNQDWGNYRDGYWGSYLRY